eukprot:g77450.t1
MEKRRKQASDSQSSNQDQLRMKGTVLGVRYLGRYPGPRLDLIISRTLTLPFSSRVEDKVHAPHYTNLESSDDEADQGWSITSISAHGMTDWEKCSKVPQRARSQLRIQLIEILIHHAHNATAIDAGDEGRCARKRS